MFSKSPCSIKDARSASRPEPQPGQARTDIGDHETDVLVIALGADYVIEATPGLAEHGDEFGA